MLTSGRGSIVEAPPPDPPTVVAAPSVMLAVAFRWDCRDALIRALQRVPREFSIVAPAEAESVVADALPRRERELATLFHLPPTEAVRLPPPAVTRGCSNERSIRQLDNLPPILRGELREACRYSPIASAFADDRPVSFCYSGWETESHWDVSIDTLETLPPARAWARSLHLPDPALRAAGKDRRVGLARIEPRLGGPRLQAGVHARRSPARGLSRSGACVTGGAWQGAER